MKERSTILIVDDSERNRMALADIPGDEYNFIEAENGARAIELMRLAAEQIYEKEKISDLMINIFSHIVEFRNGESGPHVLHIRTITEVLLNRLVQKTDRYSLTQEDIQLISSASALHDIGKVSIPDEIINKPGKLTKEEFEIMKSHTTVGENIHPTVSIGGVYQAHPLVGAIRRADKLMYWAKQKRNDIQT